MVVSSIFFKFRSKTLGRCSFIFAGMGSDQTSTTAVDQSFHPKRSNQLEAGRQTTWPCEFLLWWVSPLKQTSNNHGSVEASIFKWVAHFFFRDYRSKDIAWPETFVTPKSVLACQDYCGDMSFAPQVQVFRQDTAGVEVAAATAATAVAQSAIVAVPVLANPFVWIGIGVGMGITVITLKIFDLDRGPQTHQVPTPQQSHQEQLPKHRQDQQQAHQVPTSQQSHQEQLPKHRQDPQQAHQVPTSQQSHQEQLPKHRQDQQQAHQVPTSQQSHQEQHPKHRQDQQQAHQVPTPQQSHQEQLPKHRQDHQQTDQGTETDDECSETDRGSETASETEMDAVWRARLGRSHQEQLPKHRQDQQQAHQVPTSQQSHQKQLPKHRQDQQQTDQGTETDECSETDQGSETELDAVWRARLLFGVQQGRSHQAQLQKHWQGHQQTDQGSETDQGQTAREDDGKTLFPRFALTIKARLMSVFVLVAAMSYMYLPLTASLNNHKIKLQIQKASQTAWRWVAEDYFYSGVSEKTPEGHEYRKCLRHCMEDYEEGLKHRGKGKLQQQLDSCIKNCLGHIPTTTTSTTSTNLTNSTTSTDRWHHGGLKGLRRFDLKKRVIVLLMVGKKSSNFLTFFFPWNLWNFNQQKVYMLSVVHEVHGILIFKAKEERLPRTLRFETQLPT